MPTITTFTLCGPARELSVIKALESAPWADCHVLIDTSPHSPYSTFETAQQWCRDNHRKYVWHKIPFENFGQCLTETHQVIRKHVSQDGWICRLDTDQVLDFPECRAIVDALPPNINMLCAPDSAGPRERMWRVKHAEWIGRTHEYMTSAEPFASFVPPGWRVTEREKSEDEMREKMTRDLRLLTEDIDDWNENNLNDKDYHLKVGRANYYAGVCLEYLDRREEALHRYRECYLLSPVREQAALGAYRAARVYTKAKPSIISHTDALATFPLVEAMVGLAEHAMAAGRRDEAFSYAIAALSMSLVQERRIFYPSRDVIESAARIAKTVDPQTDVSLFIGEVQQS